MSALACRLAPLVRPAAAARNTLANVRCISSALVPPPEHRGPAIESSRWTQNNFVLLVNQRRWLKRPTPSGGPGAKAGLNLEDYKEKVMNVCKAFDKIPGEKLAYQSHFMNDLGLDSLDHVELIMAIEDEFGFEIPDEMAEKLFTPEKMTQWLAEHDGVAE